MTARAALLRPRRDWYCRLEARGRANGGRRRGGRSRRGCAGSPTRASQAQGRRRWSSARPLASWPAPSAHHPGLRTSRRRQTRRPDQSRFGPEPVALVRATRAARPAGPAARRTPPSRLCALRALTAHRTTVIDAREMLSPVRDAVRRTRVAARTVTRPTVARPDTKPRAVPSLVGRRLTRLDAASSCRCRTSFTAARAIGAQGAVSAQASAQAGAG